MIKPTWINRRSSGTASPAPQRRSRLSLPASLSGVERALPQSSAGRNPNDRSSSNSTTPGVAQRRTTVESSTANENPTTQVRQRKRTRTGEAPGTSSSTAEASNVSAEANSPNSGAPAARTRSTYSSPLKKARLQSKNPQQQPQQTSNSRSNIGAGMWLKYKFTENATFFQILFTSWSVWKHLLVGSFVEESSVTIIFSERRGMLGL